LLIAVGFGVAIVASTLSTSPVAKADKIANDRTPSSTIVTPPPQAPELSLSLPVYVRKGAVA
jgi:hypothetical protein